MPVEPFHSTPARGRTLAIGFAAAVAMWAMGYLAMMKPGLVVGEALFGLTLSCLVVGGMVAGRSAAGDSGAGPRAGGGGTRVMDGMIAGLRVGLVAGGLNLLLVGSLVGGERTADGVGDSTGDSSGARMQALAIWTVGNILLSILLSAVGGAIGGLLKPRTPATATSPAVVSWFNRFTIVAAVTVFLLLITGGLVTGLRAGLAVPDWPNSFGHNMLLYPLTRMVGGIYYEHAHRLYGMLVGVTAITLVIATFMFDERKWLRALAVAYLIMVCVQGVLGGTRVTETSIVLAIIHGVFGQVVFATVVSIAAVTSPTWLRPAAARADDGARFDRTITTVLPVMLILQLALGALYRHLRREWDAGNEPLHVLWTHIALAVLIALVAVLAGGRAWGRHRDLPMLASAGAAVLALVGGQLTLGVAAMIAVWAHAAGTASAPVPTLELIVTTAHQATGALLLSAATLLMLWTRRLDITADGSYQN